MLVRAASCRGYAKEAARSIVALLRTAGWTVVAHVHLGHLPLSGVARAVGLAPADVHNGEVRWVSPSASADLLRSGNNV